MLERASNVSGGQRVLAAQTATHYACHPPTGFAVRTAAEGMPGPSFPCIVLAHLYLLSRCSQCGHVATRIEHGGFQRVGNTIMHYRYF